MGQSCVSASTFQYESLAWISAPRPLPVGGSLVLGSVWGLGSPLLQTQWGSASRA